MKQKLVFLIALVLALAQGAAAIEVIDLTGENFTAYVGQSDTQTFTLQYVSDGAIMLNASEQQESGSLKGSYGYSFSIQGMGSDMFTITNANVVAISGNTTTTYRATVDVTYAPTAAGEHTVTLHMLNSAGRSVASQILIGKATYLMGDVDGNGQVGVADVTAIIDYLLNGDGEGLCLDAADMDGDGRISVADVSELIDDILGVPDIRRCTFIIISKTNGVTYEYIINEKTKVNIADGKLTLRSYQRTDGTYIYRPLSFSLENLAQLRYEERTVTFESKLAGVHISEEDREILKSLKP